MYSLTASHQQAHAQLSTPVDCITSTSTLKCTCKRIGVVTLCVCPCGLVQHTLEHNAVPNMCMCQKGCLTHQVIAGPSSLTELFSWATTAVQAVEADAPRWSTMCNNMANGVVMTSAWSGMRTAEMVTEFIEEAYLKAVKDNDIQDVPHKGFLPGFSCDIDPVCIKIAQTWFNARGKAPACHFEDILDRLPYIERLALKEMVDALPVRNKGLNPDELAQIQKIRLDKFAEFSKYMLKNSESIFGNGAQAPCLVCGQTCMLSTSAKFPDSKLDIEVIGNTCLGFTTFGSCEGMAHESTPALIVWASQTRARRPAVIVQECGPLFPTSFLEFWFDDLYHIERGDVEPFWVGVPLLRPRAWHWLVRKDLWLDGSFTDFMATSRRKVMLTGDDFFVAPVEVLDKDFERRMRLRGYHSMERVNIKDATSEKLVFGSDMVVASMAYSATVCVLVCMCLFGVASISQAALIVRNDVWTFEDTCV
jgi:hypothetical protein